MTIGPVEFPGAALGWGTVPRHCPGFRQSAVSHPPPFHFAIPLIRPAA